MSSEKRPSRAHRRLILLLILLLIAIAGIGLYCIRASRVRIVRAQRATVGAQPTDRYEIVEISPTQIKLRFRYMDPKTRTLTTTDYTCTRVNDKQLETAP